VPTILAHEDLQESGKKTNGWGFDPSRFVKSGTVI